MESQQAIDHVVTARGLLAKVDDSNFESLLIRNESLELLVKCLEYLILELKMIIHQHEFVLDLNKVGRLCVRLQVRQLLINLGLHELCGRFVFLNADEGVRVGLKGLRDLYGVLNSSC